MAIVDIYSNGGFRFLLLFGTDYEYCVSASRYPGSSPNSRVRRRLHQTATNCSSHNGDVGKTILRCREVDTSGHLIY